MSTRKLDIRSILVFSEEFSKVKMVQLPEEVLKKFILSYEECFNVRVGDPDGISIEDALTDGMERMSKIMEEYAAAKREVERAEKALERAKNKFQRYEEITEFYF